MENIYKITKKDGKSYSIRHDRKRYFFPDEWIEFYKTMINTKHKLLFSSLLFTGGRIMEVLHLKPENYNWDRGTITFYVIKQRKAKRNYYATGKSRTFPVSPKYLQMVKKYIRMNNIKDNEFFFLDNDKLPENYSRLQNADKKKYYVSHVTSYNQLFKRRIEKTAIQDKENFSLHNIRKTYGNWLRIFDIRLEELCYRMGHDINTYLSNYGSSLIFTPQEKRKIMNIFGEVN